MPFRRAPHLPLRPLHQLAQFLHLRMAVRRIVRQWQPCRMKDARLGTETLQQPRRFLNQQATVGALPVGAIEQQDARFVRRPVWEAQLGEIRQIEQRWIDVG